MGNNIYESYRMARDAMGFFVNDPHPNLYDYDEYETWGKVAKETYLGSN